MHSNRVFAVVVARLLTIPEHELAPALAHAATLYELDHPGTQGRIGAAVGEGGARRIPLRLWVEAQRAAGVGAVSVEVVNKVAEEDDDDDDDDEGDGLVDEEDDDNGAFDRLPHMMAGFAGGLPICVHVDTPAGRNAYTVGTVTGPMLLMTPADFVELVNLQRDPGFFWPDVLAELNVFHRCNGREDIDPDDLQSHLSSAEGLHDWEFMGDAIFREMQVEAFTYDASFVIPAKFAGLVTEVKPYHDVEPSIWLEAIDDDVTGEHLLRLIEAQDFSDAVWDLVADRAMLQAKLEETVDLDDFPELAAWAWPGFLMALPAEDTWQVCDVLLEAVILECRRLGVQPHIPEDLSGVFGPDDEERRRLHFRGRLQHDLGWRIRHVDKPSRLQVLDRLDVEVPVHPRIKLTTSKQRFLSALTAIGNFARRVDSPFARQFDFARHLAVQPDSTSLALLRAGDSAWSTQLWERAEQVVALFAPFGRGAACELGLPAVAIADVFGAMGSWNDQSFEGADGVSFHAVSAELFGALNDYFSALVPSTTRPSIVR